MDNLAKVVSGGQTGVDQASLLAARACGLAIGGWCPPGRACETGLIPLDFPLQETPSDRSSEAPDVPRSQRTEWNVRDSEATLLLRPRNADDPGGEWTRRCAIRYSRPLLECDPVDPEALREVSQWVQKLNVRILNVAGPSEGSLPGIGGKVFSLLTDVFK